MNNLTRRNVRYICFRLQTAAEGGTPAEPEETGIMSYVAELKKLMEGQPEFEGWKKFAKTWDVDENKPLVAVNRNSSIQNDWNKVLKEEAKELPAVKAKKKEHKKGSTERGPGGRFVSKKAKTETQVLLPPESSTPPPPAINANESSVAEETTPQEKEKKKFWEILK